MFLVVKNFKHIVCNCRNVKNRKEEGPTQRSLYKFEILKSRVMNKGEGSKKKIKKNRKMILREERLKKKKIVEV